MKNNKGLMMILIALVMVVLIGVVGIVLWLNFSKGDAAPKEPSIDEVVEQTVEFEEITTNLNARQFIRISLTIETDSKKAAEELEKRKFQVNSKVIKELSEMSPEDFEGKAGKQAFEETIKAQINPLMQEGEVTQVYIVSYIIQ
ncbi:flagellar basal body-associated protein FliL [Savagea sp. SN6]|uniref:Flagellar protein FliL n=1 Tax=Savagea serpentis TaxID=2785297 RepID=A0A8J7G870_9BACL|nr:flagellar basal body-associated protein FliL [Savagea serpentis]MBF4499949.1 flagellar basal body-associated protein FliL [Savagea serpentis]